eukprot:214359-Chlamydomonas_euryale.AAC.1
MAPWLPLFPAASCGLERRSVYVAKTQRDETARRGERIPVTRQLWQLQHERRQQQKSAAAASAGAFSTRRVAARRAAAQHSAII